MNPEDLLLLITRSMPYGKYKGRLIADLPGNYLNWFAREGAAQLFFCKNFQASSSGWKSQSFRLR
jgi:uncharacterized protein (DUF3820 family)